MTDPVVIIGGGLVGAALANGLVDRGRDVIVLDEGDSAFRASLGNAGLVWVQGKGNGAPTYAAWTRRSAALWPDLAEALREETGIDVEYARPGGFHLCLSETEAEARAALVERMARQPGGGSGMRMVDRAFVRDRMPDIGEKVLAASWCPDDGLANPLLLLRALHRRLALRGVAYRPGRRVKDIRRQDGRFGIVCEGETVEGGQVVLAAGLGNRDLGERIGLSVLVRPVRGQIAVTDRQPSFVHHPTTTIRQTADGTVMFGNSQEEAGHDVRTSLAVGSAQARRALIEFPRLADVRVVRCWAALRVMTPDERPIYSISPTAPGAFLATCHSGVTLAAVHARVLGPALASGTLPIECAEFDFSRFHVPSAAPA